MLGIACKKDNTTTGTSKAEPIVGNWRVSSFVKDSVDLTAQFTPYLFNSTANGGLSIHDNNNTYNSSWNWSDDNHTMCHFHIMGCDNNSVLWEVEDDWELVSYNTQSCHFKTHNPHHNSTMIWTKY